MKLDRQIEKLYFVHKKTPQEIAARFEIPIRYVHQLLSRFGPDLEHFRKRAGNEVLVFAPEHPKADKYGYVKEHIIVGEQKVGRLLRGDEMVIHRNGVKLDNRPENILVVRRAEHLQWTKNVSSWKATQPYAVAVTFPPPDPFPKLPCYLDEKTMLEFSRDLGLEEWQLHC